MSDKLKFTAADLDGGTPEATKAGCMADPEGYIHQEHAVSLLQAKLDDWLSKQVVVYGQRFDADDNSRKWSFDEVKDSRDTHRARLVCIEEMPKAECEHEPKFLKYAATWATGTTCKKCGAKLKAEWTEVSENEN